MFEIVTYMEPELRRERNSWYLKSFQLICGEIEEKGHLLSVTAPCAVSRSSLVSLKLEGRRVWSVRRVQSGEDNCVLWYPEATCALRFPHYRRPVETTVVESGGVVGAQLWTVFVSPCSL